MKHPGRALKEDFMEPLGLTIQSVARGLGVHPKTLGRFLAGQRRVSPALAAKLGAFLGVPARWWLDKQVDFDVYVLEAQPQLAQGVEPLRLSPDVFLTPSGVIDWTGVEPAPPEAPLSLPRHDLEARPPSKPALQARTARLVHYDNGSVGLVGDAP